MTKKKVVMKRFQVCMDAETRAKALRDAKKKGLRLSPYLRMLVREAK